MKLPSIKPTRTRYALRVGVTLTNSFRCCARPNKKGRRCCGALLPLQTGDYFGTQALFGIWVPFLSVAMELILPDASQV